jgi:hypothetical protein
MYTSTVKLYRCEEGKTTNENEMLINKINTNRMCTMTDGEGKVSFNVLSWWRKINFDPRYVNNQIFSLFRCFLFAQNLCLTRFWLSFM